MCAHQDMFFRGPPRDDEFEVVTRYSAKTAFDPANSWEDYATEYMEFTDTSPTVYHAVDYFARKLNDKGFRYLSERESWDAALGEGNKFYTIRNGSCIIAFVRGENWDYQRGAALTGTHIDSLAVTVKPISIKEPVDNFELIGVAPYAGALSELWWDRDLGIGGRLVLKGKKLITTKLVRIPHPVARIATLAPHYGTPSQGPFNPETQKVPFIGLATNGELPEPTEEEKKSPMVGKHSLRLLRALAREAGVKVSDILEVDLQLYDTHPATLAGLDREFLFAPRIDDKACTFTALTALSEASDELAKGENLTMVAAYDHEEVGSLTRTGARGNLTEATVDRILAHEKFENDDVNREIFWANSFFLSADVTHAANPNFTNVELANHIAFLNTGITLSRDPNGNMITDAISAALVDEVARFTNNTVQTFQIRNDSRSGGTIGPALSSKVGVRGVDIGIAQLSMHSIRAAIGSKDIWLAIRFFTSFYKAWKDVDLKFRRGDL